MLKSALSFSVIVLCVVSALGAEGRRWHFEDSQADKLPRGWLATKTGEGPGSVWKVVDDQKAPKGPHVLAQVSSEGRGRLFNLCVAQDTSYRDVDVEVSFKAVRGKIDQGGGPVWRFRDADNYYVLRMNPLEDNFRLYKVEKGKRTQLGSADVKVPAGEWHRIRVLHVGKRIQCFLDGRRYLDVTDETFPDAGKIGLWSKADAVTYFDDLRVAEGKKGE